MGAISGTLGEFATTATLPAPSSIVNGNRLLAISLSTDPGATITPDTGWTLIATVTDGVNGVMWLHTKVAASEPGDYSWAWSSGTNILGILNYAAATVDGSQTDQGATTAFATTSFAVANAGDEVVINVGNIPEDIFAAFPPGVTFQFEDSFGIFGQYSMDITEVSSTIPSYSGTWESGNPWLSIVAALTYTGTFYTVTFDGNGGTGSLGPQVGPVPMVLDLFDFSFTNGFLNFLGWNTAADGSGTSYGDGDVYFGPGDVTLYAQWSDTLPYCPVPSVQIAFDPTSIYDLGQAWYDVTDYVTDFETEAGREHFTDRIEAGTLSMNVRATDGFFYNGAVNGSGKVIGPRLPIQVLGTWQGITYPIFRGLIDEATPSIKSTSNWTIAVQASDILKQLSLRKMVSSTFWESYAHSTSAANWYSCSVTEANQAIITDANGNGTTITYKALNTYSSGDNVTIQGLAMTSGSQSLNIANAVIATASSTEFTVTSSRVGQSVGTGSVFRTVMIDKIGSNNGFFIGPVSFPQYGAMIYDIDNCVDTGNGGTTATGYQRLPDFAGLQGAIDFWVLGTNIGNSTFTIVESTGAVQVALGCNAAGQAEAVVLTVGTVTATGTPPINDGYWHHVGLVSDASGDLRLYVDGQFFGGGALAGLVGWKSISGQNTIIPATVGGLPPGAYYDEIVISTNNHLAGLTNEVANRYIAGSLLQLPTNTQQAMVSSGDRIAEILCFCGFGSIVAGAIQLQSDFFFINDGAPWVQGASGNGFLDVEPWYWDTPIVDSSALDLIEQITDTDIGDFYQKDDGTVAFHNQLYFGTWDPVMETWTPNTYTPAADHIWTDDDSGCAYETNVQVPRDDADIWTQVKVTPQAGIEQIYDNTAEQARWGITTLEKDNTLHATLLDAYQTALFLGYLYATPLPRVESVMLRAHTANGANNTALFVYLDDVVEFKSTPPNASTSGSYPSEVGAIDQQMVVEKRKVKYVANPGTWDVTSTLDPYPIRV